MKKYYSPSRIYFECGSLSSLADIVLRYGKRVFVVTTPDSVLVPLYDRVKIMFEEADINYYHFDKVSPNPNYDMVDVAFSLLKEFEPNIILALGGGSSIDTSKVLALTYGKEKIDWIYLIENYSSPYVDYPNYSNMSLPVIAVPTTSGTGSQVTQAAVITRGNDKMSIYHPSCFPKEVILDPELVKTLPLKMSMATGFDAFTHAFESYINTHHSVYSRFDSTNAIKLICKYLPLLHDDLSNIEYRKYMSLADTMAGRALSNSGADLPHPLSEIIGGITHMTHGVALACVFIPYLKVMGYKHENDFKKLAKIIDPNIKENETIVDVTERFMTSIGMNVSLKTMNISKEDFEKICSHPALKHLPFGSYEECIKILNMSYQGCL